MSNATRPDRSEFVPIPALARSDADTILIFLAGNGVQFFEATDDLWYRATTPGDTSSDSTGQDGKIQLYRPEEASSPLGCTQQMQVCNPSLPADRRCGPLASWIDAQLGAAALFNMTEEELLDGGFPSHRIGSRYSWFTMQLGYATYPIGDVLSVLQARALASQQYLAEGVMGELPENQWQLDVSHWFATYLASVQAAIVNTALGTTDPTLDPYKVLPPNQHVRELCNSQVGFQDRSVLDSLTLKV